MTQNLVQFQATCHSLILLKARHPFHNVTVFEGTSPGRQGHPTAGALLEAPPSLAPWGSVSPTSDKGVSSYTDVRRGT